MCSDDVYTVCIPIARRIRSVFDFPGGVRKNNVKIATKKKTTPGKTVDTFVLNADDFRGYRKRAPGRIKSLDVHDYYARCLAWYIGYKITCRRRSRSSSEWLKSTVPLLQNGLNDRVRSYKYARTVVRLRRSRDTTYDDGRHAAKFVEKNSRVRFNNIFRAYDVYKTIVRYIARRRYKYRSRRGMPRSRQPTTKKKIKKIPISRCRRTLLSSGRCGERFLCDDDTIYNNNIYVYATELPPPPVYA